MKQESSVKLHRAFFMRVRQIRGHQLFAATQVDSFCVKTAAANRVAGKAPGGHRTWNGVKKTAGKANRHPFFIVRSGRKGEGTMPVRKGSPRRKRRLQED
jgi:hypothetical protein